MLTIGTDPALPLAEREASFLHAFQTLRSAARAQVADQFGDDLDHATFTGEAAAAVAGLVMATGGHRMVVDPDLYASALDTDDGLVVLAGDVDDVNPPSVIAPSKLDELHAGDPDVVITEPVADQVVEPEAEPVVDEAKAARAAKRADRKAYATEVDDLRGKALDDALVAAGLTTSGKVADKRARLIANHNENAG